MKEEPGRDGGGGWGVGRCLKQGSVCVGPYNLWKT